MRRISRRKSSHRPQAFKRSLPRRSVRSQYPLALKVTLIAGFFAFLLLLKLLWSNDPADTVRSGLNSNDRQSDSNIVSQTLEIKPKNFAENLLFVAGKNDFPTRVDLEISAHEYPLRLQYSLDNALQGSLSKWLSRYDSDFAVAVALEPDSGRILALATHVSDGEPLGNLALSSAFPAASVFKIVTAAAALDMAKLTPQSVLPYNGKATSLYKKNVFEHRQTKWTRRPTLAESFARSINTVFGRIGFYTVGAQQLNAYANRFYFNNLIQSDIPIDSSSTFIPVVGNDWAVVEAASGYTNQVTLSPLHGAAIAASMVNGGKLMRPYLVDKAYDEQGQLVYAGQSEILSAAISARAADAMQQLMAKTVTSGTARRSFKGFFKGQYKDVKVGGKTGTLRGGALNGLNDWFVGYAQRGDRKLAYAILNVSLDKWKVKSHYLARLMIEQYFDESAVANSTAQVTQ